jgi:hypothetical protein
MFFFRVSVPSILSLHSSVPFFTPSRLYKYLISPILLSFCVAVRKRECKAVIICSENLCFQTWPFSAERALDFVESTEIRVTLQLSVVGIATSYGLDDREVGVRVPVGSRIFSSPDRPDKL